MRTHYEVLGIGEGVSPEEIRRAYKAQIRRFHPDVYEGPAEEATEKTIELNGAYAVLSDPERKALYDRMLAPRVSSVPTAVEVPPDPSPAPRSPEPRAEVRPPPPYRSAAWAASQRPPSPSPSDGEVEWVSSWEVSRQPESKGGWSGETDAFRSKYEAPAYREVQPYQEPDQEVPLDPKEAQLITVGIGLVAMGMSACFSAVVETDSRSEFANWNVCVILIEVLILVVTSNLPGSKDAVRFTFIAESLLVAVSLILSLLG